MNTLTKKQLKALRPVLEKAELSQDELLSLEEINSDKDNQGENSDPDPTPDLFYYALTVRKTRGKDQTTKDYEDMLSYIKEYFTGCELEGYFEWKQGLHYHALLTVLSPISAKSMMNKKTHMYYMTCKWKVYDIAKEHDQPRGWSFELLPCFHKEGWQNYIKKEQ